MQVRKSLGVVLRVGPFVKARSEEHVDGVNFFSEMSCVSESYSPVTYISHPHDRDRLAWSCLLLHSAESGVKPGLL